MSASNQTDKTISSDNEKLFDENNCENDWYFGDITRSEAENILIKNGLTDGLFLVRQCLSSAGDYVLSCVRNDSVLHYQIQRTHQIDPLFSLNHTVIHGLEALLNRLQQLSKTKESDVLLTNHCHGFLPPIDTHCIGRTGPLHQAVKQADQQLVVKLLTTADKQQLNLRDESGKTALHLAVLYLDDKTTYNWKIINQLIGAGVDVNCRDFDSITPLQLCAKLNKANFAQILVKDGMANTFDRCVSPMNWVALHFGAHTGSVEVVRVLLECGAAPQPRDSRNKRPADLALDMNHLECKKLCDFYANRPLNHRLYRNQWLLEHISSRCLANQLLEGSGMRDGSYFVRISQNNANTYILSLTHNCKAFHYKIEKYNNFYFMDSGPYWPSLEHLISYHMANSDGLPCRLTAPVSSFIDISINELLIQSTTQNNKSCDERQSNKINGEKGDKRVPEGEMKSIKFIDKKRLKMSGLIGTGEYGEVFKGFWITSNKHRVLVAIKRVRRQTHTPGLKRTNNMTDNFIKEVEVMAGLKHPNIIRLLGVCVEPTLMMIQELAPMGSVLDFLTNKTQDVGNDIIKLWSIQVACGMKYLERQHFVHRDLAARNVLLVTLNQIKISDFGLSRALSTHKTSYKASNWGRWPLKWYAPESLKYGTFNHSTDVWSYGVLLWEMYSLGAEPYPDTDSCLIIKFIDSGKRLSKPEMCADIVFGLMSLCWSYEPQNRPTFKDIVDLMSTNDLDLPIDDSIKV